jgi:predicted Zn-dependent protease
MKIEPPDLHFLNAAEGWLELGNPVEARSELARISPATRQHTSVLELEWQISAGEKAWEAALVTARAIIRAAPHRAVGWINQSYTLHELKRTREALKLLLPMAGKFAKVSTIPYNLACYACQLGDLEEAQEWLDKAITVGGKREITQQALRDSDLEPLWPKIREW